MTSSSRAHASSLPQLAVWRYHRAMTSPSAALEAVLFAAGGPLSKKRLAALLSMSDADISAALLQLSEHLTGHGLALVVSEEDAELRTAPEVSAVIKAFRESETSRDLGKASLETLAVIAYRGGATRSEVDWVRGVNSTTSVRTLLLRGLIEGKEDGTDKRRMRYVLTTEALAHLGLRSLTELPRAEELGAQAESLVEAEQEREHA